MEHKKTVSVIFSIFIHLVVFCIFTTSKIVFSSAFCSKGKENAIQVNFVPYSKSSAIKQQLDDKIKKDEKDVLQKKQIKKYQDLTVNKNTPQKSKNTKNKTQKTFKNNDINSESSKKLKHEKTYKKDIDPLKKVDIDKGDNSTKKYSDINKKSISENMDSNSTSKSHNNPVKEEPVAIDKRALYGNDSTPSRGAMLEMKGWTWDNVPVPTDTTKEVGILVFEISVNQYGEIIRINTLERTVSLKVQAIYREALEAITFSKINNNEFSHNNSKVSKGKVTFFIQYR